jgi:hypothetical protein
MRAVSVFPSAIHTQSASSLETYMTCARKYSYRYVLRIKEALKGAPELGIAMHWCLERYLEKGTSLPYSPSIADAQAFLGPGPWSPNHVGFQQKILAQAAKVAEAGLPLLPAPGSVTVEDHFLFTEGGLQFQGYRDFSRKGAVPLVGDHKSTSDLKYAKTPDELRYGAQSLLYAFFAFLENPEATEVDLQWIYYRTRGAPKSELVPLRLHKDHVVEAFGALTEIAEECATIVRDKVHPGALPPNVTACKMFAGREPWGCPYQKQCHATLTPTQQIEALMSDSFKPMSVLDRMKARQAALVKGTPTVNSVPSEVPTSAKSSKEELQAIGAMSPAEREVLAETERVKIRAEMDVRMAGVAAKSVPAPAASGVRLSAPEAEEFPDCMNPALPGYWAPETVKARIDYQAGRGLAQPINPPEWAPPPPPEAALEKGAHVDPDMPAPKKKGGRPAGSKNKPKDEAPVAVEEFPYGANAPAVVPVALEKMIEVNPTSPAVLEKFAPVLCESEADSKARMAEEWEVMNPRVLYIDCVPEGVRTTAAEELYAKAQAKQQETTGQHDYRLVDFGKGAPIFALALQAVLDASPGADAITVSTSSAEASVAMSVLRNWARTVVRGTR